MTELFLGGQPFTVTTVPTGSTVPPSPVFGGLLLARVGPGGDASRPVVRVGLTRLRSAELVFSLVSSAPVRLLLASFMLCVRWLRWPWLLSLDRLRDWLLLLPKSAWASRLSNTEVDREREMQFTHTTQLELLRNGGIFDLIVNDDVQNFRIYSFHTENEDLSAA